MAQAKKPNASKAATSAKAKGGRDTLAKVRAHLAEVETRLKAADRASHQSIAQLSAAHDLLAKKLPPKSGGKALKDLRAHVDQLSVHLDQQMKSARKAIKSDLAASLSAATSDTGRVDHVREGLARATARLTATERRQAESVQKINEQIIRLATAIDKRVSAETRAREAMDARYKSRFADFEVSTLDRIRSVEDNSANAIRKIGQQINGLSGELSKTAENAQRQMEGRIYEAALDSQHEIESLKADMQGRLDAISGMQPDVTPVARSVAAMAARLDTLEKRLLSGEASALSAALTAAAPTHLASSRVEESPPPFLQPAAVKPAATAAPADPSDSDVDVYDDPFAPPVAAPQTVSTPKPETPIAPFAPAAEHSAPVHASGVVEFDPSAYPQVSYDDLPAPNAPPAHKPSPNVASPAQAQMALHDYDDPSNGGTDYSEPESWQAPAQSTQTASQLPAPGDYDPYADNPYAAIPSANSVYNGSSDFTAQSFEGSGNPYAPPTAGYGDQDAVFDLGQTQSMAAARPGVTGSDKSSRFNLPNMNLTPRTLRTAASAAALVAVVAAGAWFAKDMLPGAATRVADIQNSALKQPGQNQDETAPQVMASAPPVNITPSTGAMSQPVGVTVNPSKPIIGDFASLDAAVAANDPIAQLQKGLTLLQNGNEVEAAKYIRLSANQGQPAAQYYLGTLYENGQGVPQDAAQGRKLTELAARAGHRIAMYDLAIYYIEGKGGVTADLSIAAQWFRKAAEFGMTDAQYNLAVLYERGTGVKADPVEAYNWYSIAGAQGDQDAASRAAQMRAELPPIALKRADSKIAAFAPSDFNEMTNGIFRDLPWNAKPNRQSQDVAQVQSLLLGMGFDAGIADGAMGPKTREAIKAFERANKLPETGQVNGALLEQLKSVSGA